MSDPVHKIRMLYSSKYYQFQSLRLVGIQSLGNQKRQTWQRRLKSGLA